VQYFNKSLLKCKNILPKQKLLLKILTKKEGFLLTFRIWGKCEVFDTFLPSPNIYKIFDEHSYLVAWLIEGYFLTEKNKEFLKDVIKRAIETFLKFGAIRVEWIGWINIAKLKNSDIIHLETYNLRDDIAPYLESLKKNNKNNKYKLLEYLASYTQIKESDDAFFDWLRFKIYDFVKTNGKEALTLEYCKELAIIGYEIMGHKKGISTPLAKAKAIYDWVIENYNPKGINNWNYIRKLTDEELEMTRRENILEINKRKAEKTKRKVYEVIKKLKEQQENIGIKKVAKIANVSVNTARKYIKQAKEEGII